MTTKQLLCFLSLFLFWSYTSTAQLVINNSFTPQQLVQNYLVGNGVTVSNVTVNAGSDPRQFGFFTNSNSNLPLASGLVMMTGYADDLNGVAMNTNGAFSSTAPTATNGGIGGPADADLDALLAPDPSHDAAVLEFDFIPLSDTVRFRYAFASEEYNEYVCSDFNDVFAFFISGPGFGAPTNIATIPGTLPVLPVAINNVNNGSVGTFGDPLNCSAQQLANSAFFIDNTNGLNVEFDGMTVALEAWAVVVPCSTYHIKLAIGDAFDGAFDSGIFLEQGSFSTNGLVVESVTANGDSIVTEQCNTGIINFNFNTPPTNDTTFFFTITGTAQNGVDYQLIADSLTVSAGDTGAIVNIIPITDSIPEGIETVILIIPTNICSSDTIILYIGEEAPPAAPDSLHCFTIQDSIIAFGWNPVAGATGYQISIDSGQTWLAPNSGQFEHQFPGVPPNTDVGIWVRSLDSNLICTMPLIDSLVCMDCGMEVTVDTMIASCLGASTGSADLTMTVGTAPFTYHWNNGDTTLNLNNVAAGFYTLSVTDVNGCTTVLPSVAVDTQYAPIANPSSVVDVTCDSLGAIALTVSGGLAPYSFTWSNGASDQNITGLAAGAYTATVSSDFGCESTVTASIQSFGPPTVTVDNTTNQTCATGGTADISATGGLGPFTYLWDNGATTEDLTGLSVGTYTLSVTGANNCVTTITATIGGTNVPVATVDSTQNQDCFQTGFINTNITSGTPAYSFLWSTGATTQNISGLVGGSYSLTVTDANSCTSILSNVQITGSVGPTILLNAATDQGCNTLGSITTNVNPGTPPYTFVWSDGQSTQDATGLVAGSYSVTVTDQIGCTATLSNIAIGSGNSPNITTNSTTNQGCTILGSIDITGTGGAGAYTYNWSNGMSTEDISALTAGTYTLTLTDGNGCTVSTPISISQTTPISLTIDSSNNVLGCDLQNIASIVANATGGTAPYSITWSNGATDANNTGLAAGTYTVTVTDGDCTVNGAATVSAPAVPSITPFIGAAPIVDSSIYLNQSILANANASNPSGSFTYFWSETNNNSSAGIATPNTATTLLMPTDTGTYVYMVIASINTNGTICSDSGQVILHVTEESYKGIPNAFSPNGDATNEYFRPLLDHSYILQFKVFNRWSQQIYDNENTQGWDGTYKGVAQPSEVYLYLLEYQLPGQDPVIVRGEVTLMR